MRERHTSAYYLRFALAYALSQLRVRVIKKHPPKTVGRGPLLKRRRGDPAAAEAGIQMAGEPAPEGSLGVTGPAALGGDRGSRGPAES